MMFTLTPEDTAIVNGRMTPGAILAGIRDSRHGVSLLTTLWRIGSTIHNHERLNRDYWADEEDAALEGDA